MKENTIFIDLTLRIEELIALDIPFVLFKRPKTDKVILLIENSPTVKDNKVDGFLSPGGICVLFYTQNA